MLVSLAGFTCAGLFLWETLVEWSERPVGKAFIEVEKLEKLYFIWFIFKDVSIETFSLPSSDLPFPAVTICKERKYDAGDYIRAVFNNFDTEVEPLKSHYKSYLSEHDWSVLRYLHA